MLASSSTRTIVGNSLAIGTRPTCGSVRRLGLLIDTRIGGHDKRWTGPAPLAFGAIFLPFGAGGQTTICGCVRVGEGRIHLVWTCAWRRVAPLKGARAALDQKS